MNEAIISLPSYSCNNLVHIQTIQVCYYMQIFIVMLFILYTESEKNVKVQYSTTV